MNASEQERERGGEIDRVKDGEEGGRWSKEREVTLVLVLELVLVLMLLQRDCIGGVTGR